LGHDDDGEFLFQFEDQILDLAVAIDVNLKGVALFIRVCEVATNVRMSHRAETPSARNNVGIGRLDPLVCRRSTAMLPAHASARLFRPSRARRLFDLDPD
jgi:hypothetical protein